MNYLYKISSIKKIEGIVLIATTFLYFLSKWAVARYWDWISHLLHFVITRLFTFVFEHFTLRLGISSQVRVILQEYARYESCVTDFNSLVIFVSWSMQAVLIEWSKQAQLAMNWLADWKGWSQSLYHSVWLLLEVQVD